MTLVEVWRPKRTATREQAERAMALLRSGDWELGKSWGDPNDPNVQYRAAMHPNVGKPGEHPGVEVWERVPGTPQLSPASPPSSSPSAKDAVLAEFEKRGWPRDEADAMIQIESGWDPSAHNKQRFGGLIGFNPGFATRYAGSPEQLWRMSIREQAPLVGIYLDTAVTKKWKYPGDTYMTGAAPAYIGAPDYQVVYRRGTKAWEQNPGWRGADGEITSGSIRALLLRKMARMKGGKPDAATPKVETEAPTQSASVPPSGSGSSLLPPGSSRAKVGSAAAGAIAAIGAALQAATGNPWIVIALVLLLLVAAGIVLVLLPNGKRRP
jgi:hypothetical protein